MRATSRRSAPSRLSIADEEIAVLALNTARRLTRKNGRVSWEQMEEIRKVFSRRRSSCFKILATHHPLGEPERRTRPGTGPPIPAGARRDCGSGRERLALRAPSPSVQRRDPDRRGCRTFHPDCACRHRDIHPHAAARKRTATTSSKLGPTLSASSSWRREGRQDFAKARSPVTSATRPLPCNESRAA